MNNSDMGNWRIYYCWRWLYDDLVWVGSVNKHNSYNSKYTSFDYQSRFHTFEIHPRTWELNKKVQPKEKNCCFCWILVEPLECWWVLAGTRAPLAGIIPRAGSVPLCLELAMCTKPAVCPDPAGKEQTW